MHYCVLLITKEFPNEEAIEKVMKKYDESDNKYDEEGNLIGERPVFQYDYYQIGGRYNGSLKLKVDLENKYYNWEYYDRTGRNGRVFHSFLLNKMKNFAKNGPGFLYHEEDYFASMGCKEGFLYVDGARIQDIINFDKVDCYICIDAEENAIARETWDGSNFIKDEQFDEKLNTIKENSKEYFAVILDIHD